MSNDYRVETGWLVEIRRHISARWWCGADKFTTDAGSAIRFAREVDAARSIAANPHLIAVKAFPTEHRWGLG